MIVSWMTTNRCNLKCAHCYQDADECDSRELSTEEAAVVHEMVRLFRLNHSDTYEGGRP